MPDAGQEDYYDEEGQGTDQEGNYAPDGQPAYYDDDDEQNQDSEE